LGGVNWYVKNGGKKSFPEPPSLQKKVILQRVHKTGGKNKTFEKRKGWTYRTKRGTTPELASAPTRNWLR